MKTCFPNAKCSFSIAKVEKIKVPCKSIMVHTEKNIKIRHLLASRKKKSAVSLIMGNCRFLFLRLDSSSY